MILYFYRRECELRHFSESCISWKKNSKITELVGPQCMLLLWYDFILQGLIEQYTVGRTTFDPIS